MRQTFPLTRCRVGVARRDITPPAGIYARWWGAATHDVAEGVHRPLSATAAVFAPLAADGPTLALVGVDLTSFPNLADERDLREAVLERADLDESELLIQMSHTHSAAYTSSLVGGKPGAELIVPYLEQLARDVGDAVLEARAALQPGSVAWGSGRCSLAANRDFWDESARRFACGYNPDVEADDTVLVGRVTGDDGAVLATIFNYACHPTTLAWANRLLSPDYVGAAREVLEQAFAAPALFLQGASGELAPRDDYVGDPAVADCNGRQLGHAAAAAIEALPPAGTQLAYTGMVASGANLGAWAYEPAGPEQLERAGVLERALVDVELERKPDVGVVDGISSTEPGSRPEEEKARRRELIRLALGDGPVHAMQMCAWRLGEALLVAVPNEPYSVFQSELRRRFAGTPVLALMMTNGGVGYLPPRETYGSGRYQEQQSPFAAGCLERTIEAAAEALAKLR